MTKAQRFMLAYIFGSIIGLQVLLFLSLSAGASPFSEPRFKIAILDTGYDLNTTGPRLKLCGRGHYDFKTGTPTIGYTNPHGTKVASIIAEQLKDVDYCAVIYQIFDRRDNMPDNVVVNALVRARIEGAKLVNMSFTSTYPSVAERKALERLSQSGAALFAAAGNDRQDLDFTCDRFPACYTIDRLYTVGALNEHGAQAKSTNYGERVHSWYSGVMEGENPATSYATPRALSSHVLRLVGRK